MLHLLYMICFFIVCITAPCLGQNAPGVPLRYPYIVASVEASGELAHTKRRKRCIPYPHLSAFFMRSSHLRFFTSVFSFCSVPRSSPKPCHGHGPGICVFKTSINHISRVVYEQSHLVTPESRPGTPAYHTAGLERTDSSWTANASLPSPLSSGLTRTRARPMMT